MNSCFAIVAVCISVGTAAAAESPFDRDDPVLVRVPGSDFKAVSEFAENQPYLTFSEEMGQGIPNIVNQSEYMLDFAYYYARAICYGRIGQAESISNDDIRSEPKPELIEVATSTLDGVLFEFACSD